MLNENIKAVRNSKGLSQEELAIKLNVVRQTVSKWERGLSVPDSEMLISISVLLGETVEESAPENLKALSEKLEVINLQLARQRDARRRFLHWFFIVLGTVIVVLFIVIGLWGSPYLDWGLNDPEHAVAVTVLHAFEWFFVRLAPFMLIGAIVGAILTRKRN